MDNGTGGVKALIADDDAFFRMALKGILLEAMGCDEVVETESLDDAITKLAERRGEFTLALFDLGMPGVAGPESLRPVCVPDSAMKVAVVSGSSRRADILAALEVGCHGYVPKGLGPDELKSALSKILDGAIYAPPTLVSARASNPMLADAEDEDENAVLVRSLPPRQKTVLALLAEGRSNKEIARLMDIGEGTAKNHVRQLFINLKLKNRSSAAAFAAKLTSGRDQASA